MAIVITISFNKDKSRMSWNRKKHGRAQKSFRDFTQAVQTE